MKTPSVINKTDRALASRAGSCLGRTIVLGLGFAAMGLLIPSVHAANATWSGGASDGLWATPGNWSASPVPGVGNTATFQNAGNGFTTIDLGAEIIIRNITFDNSLGSLGSYTIGSGGAKSQLITLDQNGAAIVVNSNVVNNQLINANVALGNGAGRSAYNLTNNSLNSLLTVAGNITGGTPGVVATLGINGAGVVVISGSISNGTSSAVALAQSGTGTLVLSGANSFTGATTVTAGALNLQNNGALGTAAGSTSSVVVSSGAALQLQGGISTTTAVALTLTGTGLTGAAKGALENVSGNNTYSGVITIGVGGATIGSDADTLTLTGGIVNGGNVATFTGAGNIFVSTTAISGAGGLVLNGNGSLLLSAANTYTGQTTVSNGTLLLGGNAAVSSAGVLGNASSNVTMGSTSGSGAVAILTTGAYTIGRSIAQTASATNTSMTIGGTHTSGTSIFSGNITLQMDTTLTAATGGRVDFTGRILNAFNLIIDGGGTVGLSATNSTFTGATIQSGTTLLVSSASNLGASTSVVSFNNGILKFGAGFDASTRTLTFNSGGATFDTNGNNVTFSNSVGGGGIGGLTKTGAGILSLNAAANYTGTTIIREGTLALGANNVFTSANNFNFSGGTLAVGSFTNTTAGALSLTGNSTITLGAGGSFTFADSHLLDWGSYTLTISGSFVDGSSIRFGSSASALTAEQLALISINGAGASLDASGYLVSSAIPEPSTFALLGGAVVLLGAGMRRRRRTVSV